MLKLLIVRKGTYIFGVRITQASSGVLTYTRHFQLKDEFQTLELL